MSWGNLRRTLQTREVGPLWHPCPSTRSSVAEPMLVSGKPLSISASSVSLYAPLSPRWYVRVKRGATVTSKGARMVADVFEAMNVVRKWPVGDEADVVTAKEDVNGGLPLEGETAQLAPGGHPETLRNTGSAEAPSTVTVAEPVSPGCRWTALGSAETANPGDGLFFNVKESITPLALSTNSYRMSVGETWNQPKPLAGGATRQAATHAAVRHVPPPDSPPVPRIQ